MIRKREKSERAPLNWSFVEQFRQGEICLYSNLTTGKAAKENKKQKIKLKTTSGQLGIENARKFKLVASELSSDKRGAVIW